jgi:hypothetical protein
MLCAGQDLSRKRLDFRLLDADSRHNHQAATPRPPSSFLLLPDWTPAAPHTYHTGSAGWQPVVPGPSRFNRRENPCSGGWFRVAADCAG